MFFISNHCAVVVSAIFIGVPSMAKAGGCFLRILLCRLLALGAVALFHSQVWAGESEGASISAGDPVVATINGETVTAGEYRLIMERKASEVFSFMKKNHNIDDHLGYWSDNSGSEGPLAKLREVVKEELVRIKTCQGLAKKKGLINDTSFAGFQTGFERENARRNAAMSAGEVIYGPTQYRRTSYYYILFGDLIYKLQNALEKEFEREVQEAEIEKYYEENRVSFKGKSLNDSRKWVLGFLCKKKVEIALDALRKTAAVEVNEPLLRTLVPRLDP